MGVTLGIMCGGVCRQLGDTHTIQYKEYIRYTHNARHRDCTSFSAKPSSESAFRNLYI